MVHFLLEHSFLYCLKKRHLINTFSLISVAFLKRCDSLLPLNITLVLRYFERVYILQDDLVLTFLIQKHCFLFLFKVSFILKTYIFLSLFLLRRLRLLWTGSTDQNVDILGLTFFTLKEIGSRLMLEVLMMRSVCFHVVQIQITGVLVLDCGLCLC